MSRNEFHWNDRQTRITLEADYRAQAVWYRRPIVLAGILGLAITAAAAIFMSGGSGIDSMTTGAIETEAVAPDVADTPQLQDL